MTTEQLYIDGKLADLKPDSHITLDIKSNLFRDIEDIVSNHTYTISLPKTANNMRLLGNLDVVQDRGNKQYSYLSCRYIRNGIVLIEDGKANILSVEDNEIQMCITWGACNAWTKIKDSNAKLTDLGGDASIVWDTKNTKFSDYKTGILQGIFYAEYNPMVIQTDDTSWQYKNGVGGEKKRIDYDATDGMIVISGTIGDVVNITPDINYHAVMSTVFSVNGGDEVYLQNIFIVADTYVYAFLDSSRKIIQCSAKSVGSGSTPTGMNMTAPSNAAYFVCNISVNSPSYYAIFRYVDKNNDYTDGTQKLIVNIQHPVVTVGWLLGCITETYGITLKFYDKDSILLRKNLSIPLLGHNGEKDQKTGVCRASFSATKTGTMSLNIKTTTGIVPFSASAVNGLSLSYACKAAVDIQATYTIPEPKRYNGTNNHGGGGMMAAIFPNYIKMVVTKSSKETSEYLSIEEPDQQITITSSDVINGKITLTIRAWGEIDFDKGDVISLQLCNSGGDIAQQQLQGTISITATISDDVIVGNNYPIVRNLPDIAIVDFIKTILVLTGTYPKQITADGTFVMARYEDIWGNISKAKNWTSKLIPRCQFNVPKQVKYVVSSWCKRNYYKWKEDDKNVYNYDGVLSVDNPVLDDERTVIELPFAASDDNRVPMYVNSKSSGKYGDKEVTSNTSYAYRGCEPRLMLCSENSTGKATLSFPTSLNLQNIIDTKYGKLAATLAKAKVITEYIHLTDLDLQDFDSSIPVYLAQYGAYFAVLEIKQSDSSYSEVTMIKLHIDREE